jgi:hypothetical protein
MKSGSKEPMRHARMPINSAILMMRAGESW